MFYLNSNYVIPKFIIMKRFKLLITTVFLLFFTFIQAQQVEYGGKSYEVKGDKIFLEKNDVTDKLSFDERNEIKNINSEQLLAERKIKEAEKAQKKAEKKQKEAEKKQKKAENEIKQKEKQKKNFNEAQDKYEKEIRQFEKQRKKGKLSPQDEEKWQKKIKELRNKLDKAKKKI